MNCTRYRVQVRYHSICHDVIEIHISQLNLAFHHVNTIIGRTLVIIQTEPRNATSIPIILSQTTIDKIVQIYQTRKEIELTEQDINAEVEKQLYTNTVFFEKGPDIEHLKKEVLELTGFSKSKVNSMTIAELKDIISLVDL